MSASPPFLRASILLALFAVPSTPVAAQGPTPDPNAVAEVRTRYSKRKLYFTMRDGARLYTNIYAPRDTSRQYPILLMRTPYSILLR